jgi:hypothetical protein
MSARLTLIRFRVLEPIKDQVSDFDQGIRAHHAVPIDPAGTEERAVGWCQHGDELNLYPDWRYGDAISMDMRIETLKMPGKELKRLVRQRRLEIEKETGSPLAYGAQQELRDLKKLELRQRVPSKITSVPMLWDMDRRRIYLASQSGSVTESFLLLFANTFKVALDIEGSGAWGGEKLPLDVVRGEYLTWLLHKVSRGPATSLMAENDEEIQLLLGDKMRLAYGEASILVDSDPDTARRAVGEGYTVREIGLHRLCSFLGKRAGKKEQNSEKKSSKRERRIGN